MVLFTSIQRIKENKSSSRFILCEVVGIEDERLGSIPASCHAIFEIFGTKPVFRMNIWDVWKVDDFYFVFKSFTVICVTVEMKIKSIWRMLLCHAIETIDKFWIVFCSPFTTNVVYSHFKFHNLIMSLFLQSARFT